MRGDRLDVRLLEHGLYYSDIVQLLLLNQPYVYAVEPSRLFVQSSAKTVLQVYVSNDFDSSSNDAAQSNKFLFCKISEDIVARAANIHRNHNICDLTVNRDIHDGGHQQRLLFQGDECRTNFTVYQCRVPYLPASLAGHDSQVHILNQMGEFVSSVNNQGMVSFMQRPVIYTVHPQILPYPSDHLTEALSVEIAGKNFEGLMDGDSFTCIFFGSWF